jgi:hypothetical protein
MTRKKIERARKRGAKKAKAKVEQMAEELGIELDEDSAARKALEYAVAVVETGKDGTREKIAAARLILDFTKKKPATTGEVTLNTTEEFLKVLSEKEPEK